MRTYETIEVRHDGRTAVITMNRPRELNALNSTMTAELIAATVELDGNDDIGAIILTGSARAFAAGADIGELAAMSFPVLSSHDGFGDWELFTRTRTPKIAAVAGFALGGGCEIAMMCDLIIAAETAKFGLPEVRLGLIPGMGGTQRMARAIGKAKTMELVLTGGFLNATDAERAGLVSRVVPADQLLSTTHEVADKIASLSLPVAKAAKDAVDTAFESLLTAGITHERHVFHSLFALEDAAEGIAAFREKRAPQFRHR